MAKKYETGLAGLLNNAAPAARPDGQEQAATGNGSVQDRKKKTGCYMVDAQLEAKIKYIAYYDRKTISDVVNEAFEQYVSKWKPDTKEPSIP